MGGVEGLKENILVQRADTKTHARTPQRTALLWRVHIFSFCTHSTDSAPHIGRAGGGAAAAALAWRNCNIGLINIWCVFVEALPTVSATPFHPLSAFRGTREGGGIYRMFN